MFNLKEIMANRGYSPLYPNMEKSKAWHKPGRDKQVATVVYDQADFPSFKADQAFCVSTEIIRNAGCLNSTWVHKEASELRLLDEIAFSEMLACENRFQQKEIAAQYLGKDLLTTHLGVEKVDVNALKASELSRCFDIARIKARSKPAPDFDGTDVEGFNLFSRMFDLDGVVRGYSRFRFKEAPVNIEVVYDGTLGSRIPESGYLVTADVNNKPAVHFPYDFTKVAVGCHEGECFAKVVLLAAAEGLAHMSKRGDEKEAFNLLSSSFELDVLADSYPRFDEATDHVEKWKELIQYGYRFETGVELTGDTENAPTP